MTAHVKTGQLSQTVATVADFSNRPRPQRTGADPSTGKRVRFRPGRRVHTPSRCLCGCFFLATVAMAGVRQSKTLDWRRLSQPSQGSTVRQLRQLGSPLKGGNHNSAENWRSLRPAEPTEAMTHPFEDLTGAGG